MPRPTTKQDLILAANEQFDKLWKLIETMSEEERSTAFCFDSNIGKGEAHWTRDKKLRDIFIHLHEWHRLLLNWVTSNQKGEAKPFLPEPYNWKTYGDMNVMFWEKHQATPYDDSKKMFCNSHKNVLDLIEQFSNEELFAKKSFSWVGGSKLGSYCVSVTSSHYDWAMKKIKTHIEICRRE